MAKFPNSGLDNFLSCIDRKQTKISQLLASSRQKTEVSGGIVIFYFYVVIATNRAHIFKGLKKMFRTEDSS